MAPARRVQPLLAWPALLLLAAVLAAPVTAAAPPSPLCDGVAPLALLGMDTTTGRMLFTLSAAGDLHLVEVDVDGDEAALHPLPPGPPPFAGSVGPGPVLALERCGESCVQPRRWEGGEWNPLGAALPLSRRANFYTTYDRSGAPWVLAHRQAGEEGWVEARAFRFTGGRWQDRGRLAVTSVTTQGAAPAQERQDGVVSGTGLFTAAEAPVSWVAGLPALPAEKRGQVLPLGAEGAVYLAADGGIYLSADGGRSWRGTRWRPWGVERTAIWTFGADYSLDTPLGNLDRPLPVAWFDRRHREAQQLILTTLTPDGAWELRAELPGEILADTGDRLEIIHFLRTAGGTWVLLSDCFAAGSTSGLARRTYSPAGPSPPRFVVVR